MELSALELPLITYAISRQLGNNYFTVTLDTTTIVIIVPDGNYTPKYLTDYLNKFAEKTLPASFYSG